MASVLLVEDNDDHAILAKATLLKSAQEYEVDRAKSADECLVMLKNRHYEAIVLDYSLPKKNGLEILKEIKEISYNAPVVMITSHGDEQIAVEAMKCGAYDYVSKSDDYLNKLPRVLQKAIEAHELVREKSELQVRIEESENRLRNIFENVEVGLIEIKGDCSISYVNPKAKHYLNATDDLQATRVCKIFLKEREGIKNCQGCLIRKCLESGNSISCEIDYNNRQFSGTITATQVTESGSRQLVVVMMDVTEQRELQGQLIQSERIGALGRMASGIAHDFNNILAAVLGRTELMLMDLSDTKDIEKSLRIIRQVALDGADTVKRIQEFTGVAKQKEFTKLSVNDIVKGVIQMTEPRWKDQPQRDGIKLDILTELNSRLCIEGSASDLREALINMVFNALEAMPNGGILSFKTYEENNIVYVSISDNGVGIPQGVIGSIFEPFFTSKGVGHSGLGLSVAYGIISRHGGKIDVNSIYGKGTTFTISLPGHAEKPGIEKECFSTTRIQKTNILAIDDEEVIRELLTNILARFDSNVTTAADGMSGIEIFQAGKYDIVFTDLGMPEISGWEVAQRIKALDPNVKLILLTGWGVELDEKELREKKIDAVINKPFQIEQIVKAVSNLSQKKGKI